MRIAKRLTAQQFIIDAAAFWPSKIGILGRVAMVGMTGQYSMSMAANLPRGCAMNGIDGRRVVVSAKLN
jgi:hypothetical protein